VLLSQKYNILTGGLEPFNENHDSFQLIIMRMLLWLLLPLIEIIGSLTGVNLICS